MTTSAVTDRPVATRSAYRVTVAGAALGALAAIVEALLGAFTSQTSGTAHYQHAADYGFTAVALPVAVAAVLVLFGVRALQHRRDGRLGLVGVVLATVCLAVLSAIIVASLVAGHDVQAGPGYMLGTLGAFLGTALFAAGSWRAGLLPRWLLVVWPIVWVIGSFAAVSASPFLLAAFYVVLLVVLHRRPAS